MDACFWLYNKPGGTQAENWWQDDLPGYIFLPRAFHQIASSQLGAAWTGKEPAAIASIDDYACSNKTLPAPERQVWADVQHMRLAERLLQFRYPDFVAPRVGGHPNLSDHHIDLTPSQWTEAREILQLLQDDERRFEGVKLSIIEALREGNLVAALRPYDDPTKISDCPKELWRPNVTDQRVRFYYCRLNPLGTGEIDRETDGAPYCWIYITKDSLTRFLNREVKRPGRKPGDVKNPGDAKIIEQLAAICSAKHKPRRSRLHCRSGAGGCWGGGNSGRRV